MHHQRHGGAGYFNHFHIKNHANSAHIFYIVKNNNSDYLKKARKYGHFTGYKN